MQIKETLKKVKPKTYTAITLGIALTATIFFAGMYTERSRYSAPLPANKACEKYAEQTPKFYQAQTAAVYGIPVPKDTITAEKLNELKDTCHKTVNEYNVTMVGK